MITRKNESKSITKHVNVNVNLMVKNIIKGKSGTKNCADLSAK